MTTLTATILTNIRRKVAKGRNPNWSKAQLDAAAQAVEDRLVNSAGVISADIDTATSPLVLPAGVKKALVAYVLENKFLRDKD